MSPYKIPLILVRFLSHFNFRDRFSKIPQTYDLIKIRPEAAELFHADRQADGQTDRYAEDNCNFSQFCASA
jgi:hypothetical protein